MNSGVAMTARRPNFFDRWCAAVGLAFPIVTGDPLFDGRIQVDTGDREEVFTWLADVRFREGLLGLFDPGVMRVVCENGSLSLVRKLKPKETVAPSMVFEILPGLRDLAEYMIQTADPTAQRRPSTNQAKMRWGLAPGLVLMTGIILIIAGMSLYETLLPFLLAGDTLGHSMEPFGLCRLLPGSLAVCKEPHGSSHCHLCNPRPCAAVILPLRHGLAVFWKRLAG